MIDEGEQLSLSRWTGCHCWARCVPIIGNYVLFAFTVINYVKLFFSLDNTLYHSM